MENYDFSEIITALKTSSPWIEDIIDIVKFFEFKLIGKGTFASVFGKQDFPVAIKIIDKIKAPVNVKYLKYSFKNHFKNPYLPKVYEILELQNFCIVFQEKLIHNNRKAGYFISTIHKNNSMFTEAHFFKKQDENLENLYVYINTLIKSEKIAMWDMCTKNIMYRKNNKKLEMVLNDPIYDGRLGD